MVAFKDQEVKTNLDTINDLNPIQKYITIYLHIRLFFMPKPKYKLAVCFSRYTGILVNVYRLKIHLALFSIYI